MLKVKRQKIKQWIRISFPEQLEANYRREQSTNIICHSAFQLSSQMETFVPFVKDSSLLTERKGVPLEKPISSETKAPIAVL